MHGSYLKLVFFYQSLEITTHALALYATDLASEGDIGIISQAAIIINCTTSSAIGSLTFWS